MSRARELLSAPVGSEVEKAPGIEEQSRDSRGPHDGEQANPLPNLRVEPDSKTVEATDRTLCVGHRDGSVRVWSAVRQGRPCVCELETV